MKCNPNVDHFKYKSPTVGIRLNDDDRQPFRDSNDERLTFLVDMATCFKKMNNSVLSKRIRGFTNDKWTC